MQEKSIYILSERYVDRLNGDSLSAYTLLRPNMVNERSTFKRAEFFLREQTWREKWRRNEKVAECLIS